MLMGQGFLQSRIHLFVCKIHVSFIFKGFSSMLLWLQGNVKKFFKGFHPVPQFGYQDGFVVVPEILN